MKKRLPHYIRKPVAYCRLCYGGKQYDGSFRDIGIAKMRNGDLIPFDWGDAYTLEQCRELRRNNPDWQHNFVQLGKHFARTLNDPARFKPQIKD